MDVIVYDPAGKAVGRLKIKSLEELGQEVGRVIKDGSVKENYYLECQEYCWKISMGGEGLFLEKMANKVPEASKDQTEFNKSTSWSGFWYFLAAANMLTALVSLFAAVSGSSLASTFFISSITGAIIALFFGWISEVANHIRWLLSEQLKELKRR